MTKPRKPATAGASSYREAVKVDAAVLHVAIGQRGWVPIVYASTVRAEALASAFRNTFANADELVIGRCALFAWWD